MKLKFYNLFVALFLLTFVNSVSAQRVQNSSFEQKIDRLLSNKIPTITVKQAQTFLTNSLLLDARELEEYNVSHIPNAKYIGYDDFDLSSIAGISKDETIIIYCSIGYRSEHIGAKIQEAGYQKVYNLYGSIFEWVNQGLPIVDSSGNKTLQVHTYNKNWSKWVEHPDIVKVW